MKIGMSKLRFFILFCIVCSPGLMIPQLIVNDEPSIQDIPLTTETVMEKTASMSMPFIKNEGQADPKVKFYANTFAGTAYLTENDLTYVIPTEDGSFVIKEAPHGGDLTPSADAPSETVVNYFKGTEENWHTDVPTYDSVSAGFVWDGVSLSLKAYGNNIEKLFTVFPGTNPNVIKMNFDGVKSLSVDESGELLLHTSIGDITMTAPVAYQHIDGIKKFVPVKYSISSSSYGFVLGDYEKTLPVVIDPLLASTFLGAGQNDRGYAIAIDSSGNVFVTGYTGDYTPYLAATSGAYDESHNSGVDLFVSKFSDDLTSLSASTFFGGAKYDYGYAIAIDSSDNVFVSGETTSTDLPTTDGAYNESQNGGNTDAFVSKFSNDLTSLSASTYLGGDGSDYNKGSIAIDSSGNVFVSGHTTSSNFPTTDGAYDESWTDASTTNTFVSKFSNDLTSLSASTFVSTSYRNYGAIAIDSSDNVFVAAVTPSGFATTDGAYDESFNGNNYDGHVSKFSNDLTSLSASTYLGGSGQNEIPYDMAIDSSGNVFVTGRTGYDDTDFPTTSGAYDESQNGNTDAFVSKFSNDLTSLSASTFLGGSRIDIAHGIAIDSSDNVFVTGETRSMSNPAIGLVAFPTTDGAYDRSRNGSPDAFISKFSNDLTSLSASTFLGGGIGHANYGYAITIDSSGNVFVIGETTSTDFPTTDGAYDESWNGGADVIVSKFSTDLNLDVAGSASSDGSSDGSSDFCYDCEAPKLAKVEVHITSQNSDTQRISTSSEIWHFDQKTPYPMFDDYKTPIIADPGDEVQIILELTDNRTLKKIADSGTYTNFLTKPNDMNRFYANNFDESSKVSTTYYEWHQTGDDLVYDYDNTVEWSPADVTIEESGELDNRDCCNLDDLAGTFTISFKMKFLQPMQTTDVWVQGTDRSGNFFKVALPLTLKVAGNEPLVFESKVNQKVLGFYDESMLNEIVSDWTGSTQDVSELATVLGIADEQLPPWVTNLAVWVSEDRITLADMIVSIEHLINN